jgi:alpha-D-ribose 1-methylphosphonate 5-triphosphate diphosphatase PhnM
MVSRKGGRPDKRLGSIKKILSLIAKSRSQTKTKTDPLMIIRKKLEYDNTSLNTLEEIVEEDLVNIISSTQELYGQEIS